MHMGHFSCNCIFSEPLYTYMPLYATITLDLKKVCTV